jgi:serine/threonine protein kinase/Tol biopolymer transport system component
MIGQSIAHYEVTSLLGEGGMGRVFRARDTRLGRDVALKLLPAEVAETPERLARFDREARTLAQLQHPNVASIYGFEQVNEHRFLVMELAEGQDLADRMASGALSLALTLDIARQIALGLEAAHDKGIVHRDLKPANVMLGDDGQVKILDFGLARALDEPTPAGQLEHSPTITAAMTQAGMILGTAAYMSPEQARGYAVNQRSDVWAFGAVLFEMITGKKPFPGEVVSDILAKILERDPPWDELPEQLHPAVRRLLQRCLVKNPVERLHSIADASLEIQEALTDPTGSEILSSVTDRTATRGPTWRRALPWLVSAGLAVALVTLLIQGSAPTPPKANVQFKIAPPVGRVFAEFRVAPDGSALVAATNNSEGKRTLWLRRINDPEIRELAGTEGATFPFWSADSSSIAFFSQGKLRRLDLVTGTMQTVTDAVNGRGGDWHSDGTILFTPKGEGVLYTVPATGGTPKPATQLSGDETSHRFPHFLPGSRRFAFAAHAEGENGGYRYFGSLDSEEIVPLPEGMSEAYLPPGYLFYIRENTLFANRFNASSGQLLGDPLPLTSGIDDAYPRNASSSYSVSNTGMLAYMQLNPINSRFQWFDRNGKQGETVGPEITYASPSLSIDGKRILFVGDDAVSVLDLKRGASTRVADRYSNVVSVSWGQEDRSILARGENGVIRYPSAGGSPDLIFGKSTEGLILSSIRDQQEAADGSFIVFTAWDPATDYDLWTLQLDKPSEPQSLGREPQPQRFPTISPDSRWIAYQSERSGRFEIYLRRSDAEQIKWLVSTDGGQQPTWSPDGSELYYLTSSGDLMAVPIGESDGDPQIGLPVPLFNAPVAPPQDGLEKVPHPRLVGVFANRFLFQVPVETIRPTTITVVTDWEQLLPQ